jgi:hypothetical protein
LAAALETNTDVGHVFIFILACFSGGFGPEIMATTNASNTWCSTTCTENGYGWEAWEYNTLAWTHFFLEEGLMDHFEGQNVSMEDTFDWAYPLYIQQFPDPGDRPQEFDGNEGLPFLLDPAAKSTVTDWFQVAPAVTEINNSTLGKRLQGYVKVVVKHIDWADIPENRTISTGEITNVTVLEKIFNSLNPNQRINKMAATCLFSHILDYLDADGNIIGRVGICDAPKFGDNHHGVLVNINSSKETISREGIIIPDALSLIELVENHISR